MFFCSLKEVKILVALVSPVHDPGFTRLQNFTDKWPFSAFTVGEEKLSRNAPVDVKANVGFGFLGSSAVTRHRKDLPNPLDNCKYQNFKEGAFCKSTTLWHPVVPAVSDIY